MSINFLKGNNYTNSVQILLRNIGNKQISNITVNRVPLSSTLNFLLNLTSRGEYQNKINELGYDAFYHLFLVITIGSKKYILEKNEVISLKSMANLGSTEGISNRIRRIPNLPKGTESLSVELYDSLTLNVMLENTKSIMKDKFYLYDARQNNCQYFLSSVLNANNLGDDLDKNFITQDTEYLFENNPNFRKTINRITDTGSVLKNANDNINYLSPVLTGQKLLFNTSNLLRPQEKNRLVLFPFRKLI